MKTLCLTALLICTSFAIKAQTITGTVLDATTQKPLETVAVYFDNTTIGTTTDENGRFTITYTDAIKSGLIFSYLGYETLMVSDYRSKTSFNIVLRPSINELDTVVINEDDGLTRQQKLRIFKREFLGQTEIGRRCKIENEDDIYLRYNASSQTLIAQSKRPLIIRNKGLKYLVTYDIVDFEIQFRHVEPENDIFSVYGVGFSGTAFYEDLMTNKRSKRTKKLRQKTFEGSVHHFMRALYNKQLEEQGYTIFFDKFKVKWPSYIKVNRVDNSDLKSAELTVDKVSILYNGKQSGLTTKTNPFYIDKYGNHSPVNRVLLSGEMAFQRVGDILPLDYDFSM